MPELLKRSVIATGTCAPSPASESGLSCESVGTKQVGLEFQSLAVQAHDKDHVAIVLWKKPQRSSRPKIG